MEKFGNRLISVVGVVLFFGGLAAIYVAWTKASTQELEIAQLPYLLSGGFGGVALVVLGCFAFGGSMVARSISLHRLAASEAAGKTHELLEQIHSVLESQASSKASTQNGSDDSGSPTAKTSRRRERT